MSDPPQNPAGLTSRNTDSSATALAVLLLLTVVAFLLMGYHPGLEDDAYYLAAIKHNLNPFLFPHDAEFFALQFQATAYDKLVAVFVRVTHLPLAWTLFLWQFAAIFLILHGCWRISRRCFADRPAQWGAVTMIAVLLALPVSGTGINLVDQYLHPRSLATAAIAAAVVEVLDRRLWLAGILLAFAFANHALMASFGISFCFFLWWNLGRAGRRRSAPLASIALLAPLGWIFEPSSDAWRQAASTRSFYYLSHWQWYEWLGVFAPLVLIYASLHLLRRGGDSHDRDSVLRSFVASLFYYGVFQTIVGLIIMLPPRLERLRPFEPMRYLHLLYLFFFLIVGALLGRYLLGRHIYRWVLLFVPLGSGMFYAQRQMYPASQHLELPGRNPANAWVQAFTWIRQNTPVDSYFALDPLYMPLPGEDFHGFRALAERSAMADFDKDGGMAARVPRLAPRWLKEVTALKDWRNFQGGDFAKLKNEFGVNWVVLSRADADFSSQELGTNCPYRNATVAVCRVE
ncbi:MAG TPA: hypothetical protein VEJ00_09240 [Candidatus Acidoferrales bacterium]|nr:hypothetical protein [Candidatus Acidoferrales bacterium]